MNYGCDKEDFLLDEWKDNNKNLYDAIWPRWVGFSLALINKIIRTFKYCKEMQKMTMWTSLILF